MKNYKLVVFDWDGTLMDSFAKIVSCYRQTASRLELPIPNSNVIESTIGLDVKSTVRHLYPGSPDTLVADFLLVFKQIYRSDTTHSPMYDGVSDMLSSLKRQGLILAIATSRTRESLRRELLGHDLEHYFSLMRCAGETKAKPHKEMLHSIVIESGVSYQETLLVGDSIYDLGMAKALEIDSVAISPCGKLNLREYAPIEILSHINGFKSWLFS